jgi:DNA polymerase-3 subunit alpha (Gram-positive type)
MSVMDGVGTASDYIKRAKEFGMDAIAITDHNSVQAFPDASYAEAETGVKVIYGVELDIINDIGTDIVINSREQSLTNATYVFFDLETTGLSPLANEIIEFGGVKVKDGKVIDKLQLFINPSIAIPKFTTQLTGITDADVEGAPEIKEAIEIILNFIDDSILVAHNAEFDYNFLNSFMKRNNFGELKNPTIDTMKIS